jgi:glycosyltransferase involved in cell wall biosynthesis
MSQRIRSKTIILLAPTRVVGGITTWLKIWLKYSKSDQVKLKIIDTSKLYDPLGKKYNIRGVIIGVIEATSRFFTLVKWLYHDRPHAVYLTCAPSLGFVFRDCFYMFFLKILHIPTIAHLHGGSVERFLGGNVVKKTVVRSALDTCKAVFVITREVEMACREIFADEKIIYVPNMYDDEVFLKHPPKYIKSTSKNKPFRLLHVAWQATEKGSLDLVESIKHVQSEVICDLVGMISTDFEKTLREKISEYCLENRVRILGQKTGRDLIDLFEKADLFVFPSHMEGFPMVILEAMAYGIPIIANEVGNIREMIGADDGNPAGVLLRRVSPIYPLELAKLIDELIMEHGERSRMSYAGKIRIKEKYLASRVVPVLEDHINRIIHGNYCKQSVTENILTN